MWSQRVKGLIVILVIGFLTLGAVRYLTTNQKALVQGIADFSPEKAAKSILGAVSQLGKRGSGSSSDNQSEKEGVLAEPIRNVEKKATELLEEIKKLPGDQLETVKGRVLEQVCGELEKEGEKDEPKQ
jgi:hypothetical protein